MNMSEIKFDEEYVILQLNHQYKQGYTSVLGMVAFLRNDYRDLTIEQAVKTVNKWIDTYKIKHEHLAVAYNRVKKQKVVVTQSIIDKIRERDGLKK